MANFKGVLFDLDGTLLDTAKDLGASLNYVLSKYGLPLVAEQQFRPVASDGSKGLIELGFGQKLTQFSFEELKQEFLNHYEKNSNQLTCLFDHIDTLINHLDKEQIAWGIVTNKPGFLTDPLLKHFDLLSNSKSNISGDTLAERKPHPAPLLCAASELAIEPDNILYVGDALRDIQAGNSAGMATAVANWGYIKESDNVNEWQANHIVDCPRDILNLL